MKRALTGLCLILCLAPAVAAQDGRAGANANAAGAQTANSQNKSGANADINASANADSSANVNANSNAGTGSNAGVGGNANIVTLEVHPGQTARIVVGRQDEQGGGIDPWWKDFIDIMSKALTIVSIGVAVFLAVQQVSKNREERAKNELERKERHDKESAENKKDREQSERNREQRAEDLEQRKIELRWKKAGLARVMLDELHGDPYATDAMLMLDWSRREFCVKVNKNQPRGKMMEISWDEMWAGLRITERHFNEKEKFIRDCFDIFFGYMQTIEHYLSIDLIELTDVLYPFDYYISLLDKNAIMPDIFVGAYHPRAADFIKRVKDFQSKKDVTSPPYQDVIFPPYREVVSPPHREVVSPPQARAAYFLFDCPPGEERFVFRLEDSQKIEEARSILSGGVEKHVKGDIVEGAVYYNEPWQFHIEPESVG
ncbi:MAG: hypothetical protein QOJ76_2918, partial [Acidobacteriota bacterium]|nr:hypothetical protein [Acidobacteriota bacterium]